MISNNNPLIWRHDASWWYLKDSFILQLIVVTVCTSVTDCSPAVSHYAAECRLLWEVCCTEPGLSEITISSYGVLVMRAFSLGNNLYLLTSRLCSLSSLSLGMVWKVSTFFFYFKPFLTINNLTSQIVPPVLRGPPVPGYRWWWRSLHWSCSPHHSDPQLHEAGEERGSGLDWHRCGQLAQCSWTNIHTVLTLIHSHPDKQDLWAMV